MLHFIYNPIAGKGRTRRVREALESRLSAAKAAYAFHETKGHRSATDIVRKLTGGGEETVDIVSMGGDGTLHEVLNGMADPGRVRLGIIPCGSGNDFAAVAGIPSAPDGALDLLLNGEAKFTDYMECSGVRGINAIGTGIDVDILRRYNGMKLLKGSAAYLASLIITLFSYKPKRFSEVVGDERRLHRAFIACAGNGQRIGGGISICPEAVLDDGLLDIVIVDDISAPAIPAAFMKLMKRKILEHPKTTFRQADSLRIEPEAPMPVQIDGEIYENLPFDVRVVSNRLRVYRP